MLTKEQFIEQNPLLTVEEQDLAYQSYCEAELLKQYEAEQQKRLETALLKQRIEAVIKGDVGHPAIRLVLPECQNFAYDLEQIIQFGDLKAFVEQLELVGVGANAKMAQDQLNIDNQKFLDNTDWMVLRHLRQVALGIQTSLTQEQYLALEQERQLKSQGIIR